MGNLIDLTLTYRIEELRALSAQTQDAIAMAIVGLSVVYVSTLAILKNYIENLTGA